MTVKKNSVSAYRTQIQSRSSRSRSATPKRRVDRYVPSVSRSRRRPKSHPQPEIIIRAVAEPKKSSNRYKKSSTRDSKSSTRVKNSSTSRRTASSVSQRRTLSWREHSLLTIIGVSAAAILCAFVFGSSFNPERTAEKSLAKLAKFYYTEYLYPATIGVHKSNPAGVLTSYASTGLPTAYLYQMLHYNNDAHLDELKNFDNQYYSCNTSRTSARFYPIEPYGPNDYTVQYTFVCEKKNLPE